MGDRTGIELRLDWSDTPSLPVLAANQLLVQVDSVGAQPDSFILTIGYASGPPVTGTPEEQAEQLRAYQSVHVAPITRISVTRARMIEWLGVLQETVGKVEAVRAQDENRR